MLDVTVYYDIQRMEEVVEIIFSEDDWEGDP